MKRKKLLLSIVTAAALGSFGAANAHDVDSSLPSDSSVTPSYEQPQARTGY